jgi:hypothetical protein
MSFVWWDLVLIVVAELFVPGRPKGGRHASLRLIGARKLNPIVTSEGSRRHENPRYLPPTDQTPHVQVLQMLGLGRMSATIDHRS